MCNEVQPTGDNGLGHLSIHDQSLLMDWFPYTQGRFNIPECVTLAEIEFVLNHCDNKSLAFKAKWED